MRENMQIRRAVALITAPENMVMRAGHIANTIELDVAQLFENRFQCRGTQGRTRQALCLKPEPARLLVRNMKACGNRLTRNGEFGVSDLGLDRIGKARIFPV